MAHAISAGVIPSPSLARRRTGCWRLAITGRDVRAMLYMANLLTSPVRWRRLFRDMPLSRDSRQILLGVGIGIVSIAVLAGVYIAGQKSTAPVISAPSAAAQSSQSEPIKPVSTKTAPTDAQLAANARRLIDADLAGDHSVPLPGRQDLKPPEARYGSLEPRLGWREIRTIPLDINPGNMVFLFDLPPGMSVLRYHIASSYPLTFAYMPSALREPLQQGKFTAAFILGSSECVERSVSSRTVECANKKDAAGSTVLLVDERAAPNQVVDFLGRAIVHKLTGQTLPAQGSAVNHANVVISLFACVENCPNKQDAEIKGTLVGTSIAQSELVTQGLACRTPGATKEEVNQCMKSIVDRLAPIY